MCSLESNVFTDCDSIKSCVELLEIFTGSALQSGYYAWSYVDIHDKESILKSLMSRYRGLSSAAGVDKSNLGFSVPETLAPQDPYPSQPPLNDAVEVRSLLQ